ncbi:class I SAM-dependent methyltransferase [Candidatus Micrarchaeota archaeon]|nr:class I SAM-dependent methyltransferase [Candidatus Micrarchaeota archaeon]
MGFYEDFIEKYDKLVSWKNRSMTGSGFFRPLFSKHKVKKVLDCACGTGQHVITFNQMGFPTKGSDLSPAMIRKAREHAREYKIKTTFKIADFRNLSKAFKEKFDAVICVGNSLPHLSSEKDLSKALGEMHKVLNKNGVLMLEQRNYDLLLSTKKRFFPVSVLKDEVFFYVLDYFPNKIVFNVVDVENKTKNFNVYSTDYCPLSKSRLTRLLRKVGFRNMKFYGSYNLKAFDIKKDSWLLVVCEK